jgi:hypothetical protein
MTKSIATFNPLIPGQLKETLASIRKRILKDHFNVGCVDYAEWARRFDERSASLLGST